MQREESSKITESMETSYQESSRQESTLRVQSFHMTRVCGFVFVYIYFRVIFLRIF